MATLGAADGVDGFLGIDFAALKVCIELLEVLGQFLVSEAQQLQINAVAPKLTQLDGQKLYVPLGSLGSAVVGQAVGPRLLGRQVRSNMDRHGLEAQLQCRLVAGIAHHDHAVLVHHDGLPKAEFTDGVSHGLDGLVVAPRVLAVRLHAVDVPLLDLHGLRVLGWL